MKNKVQKYKESSTYASFFSVDHRAKEGKSRRPPRGGGLLYVGDYLMQD